MRSIYADMFLPLFTIIYTIQEWNHTGLADVIHRRLKKNIHPCRLYVEKCVYICTVVKEYSINN